MTFEEGILFKIKALFKRSEEFHHVQCVSKIKYREILTRNVLCPHVGCPSGGGDVSEGTQPHLPEARSRLRGQQ